MICIKCDINTANIFIGSGKSYCFTCFGNKYSDFKIFISNKDELNKTVMNANMITSPLVAVLTVGNAYGSDSLYLLYTHDLPDYMNEYIFGDNLDDMPRTFLSDCDKYSTYDHSFSLLSFNDVHDAYTEVMKIPHYDKIIKIDFYCGEISAISMSDLIERLS